MASDRIFGLVMLFAAAGYIFAAQQAQSGFMSDPIGPRAFPTLIGIVAGVCSVIMILRPDPDPDWPVARTLGSIAFAVVVLIAYAYSLKPIGFIIPTFVAAGFLSFQLSGRPVAAILAGLGLSIGLFVLFKFILDLGLIGVSDKLSPYLPFMQPTIDLVGSGFEWLGGLLPDFRPVAVEPTGATD